MTQKRYIATIARWSGVLTWTIIVLVVLFYPAKKSISHDLTLHSFISLFFSISYDAWDLAEAIVHVILFAILTLLWYWVFLIYLSKRLSLLIAINIATIIGVITEVGQYLVNRDSMLLDLLANLAGIAICVVWIKLRAD